MLDIFYGNRVDSGKRFVEHDEFRVNSQATRYFRTPAFSSGKLVTQILAHLLQTELCDQAFQFFFLIFGSGICQFKHRSDIVFHTHLAEHRSFLRQIADTILRTLIYGVGRNIHIIQIDMSFVGNDQSGRHVKRSRLSRSVRTEKSHDFTLLHVDGNMTHNRSLAIFLDQILRTKHHTSVGWKLKSLFLMLLNIFCHNFFFLAIAKVVKNLGNVVILRIFISSFIII